MEKLVQHAQPTVPKCTAKTIKFNLYEEAPSAESEMIDKYMYGMPKCQAFSYRWPPLHTHRHAHNWLAPAGIFIYRKILYFTIQTASCLGLHVCTLQFLIKANRDNNLGAPTESSAKLELGESLVFCERIDNDAYV